MKVLVTGAAGRIGANLVKALVEAGHGDRILLSHDAGWYQPGSANGGAQRPYTYLSTTFLPALRASGADEDLVRLLTVENPRRAFALAPTPNRCALIDY